MINQFLSPLSFHPSTQSTKSWLVNLHQPHSSTDFSFEKSFASHFPATKPHLPLKPFASSTDSRDFKLVFPSSTVTKPFLISNRSLMNRDIPILDFWPPFSNSKVSKSKKKKAHKKRRKIENIVKRHALGFSSIENLDFFKHYYRLLIKNIFLMNHKQPKTKNQNELLKNNTQTEKDISYVPLEIRNFFIEKTKQDLFFFEKLVDIYEKNKTFQTLLGNNEYMDSNKFDKIANKINFLPIIKTQKTTIKPEQKLSTQQKLNILDIKLLEEQKEIKVFKETEFLRNLLTKFRKRGLDEVDFQEISGLKEIIEEKKLILKGMEQDFTSEKEQNQFIEGDSNREDDNNVLKAENKKILGVNSINLHNEVEKEKTISSTQLQINKSQKLFPDKEINVKINKNDNINNSKNNEIQNLVMKNDILVINTENFSPTYSKQDHSSIIKTKSSKHKANHQEKNPLTLPQKFEKQATETSDFKVKPNLPKKTLPFDKKQEKHSEKPENFNKVQNLKPQNTEIISLKSNHSSKSTHLQTVKPQKNEIIDKLSKFSPKPQANHQTPFHKNTKSDNKPQESSQIRLSSLEKILPDKKLEDLQNIENNSEKTFNYNSKNSFDKIQDSSKIPLDFHDSIDKSISNSIRKLSNKSELMPDINNISLNHIDNLLKTTKSPSVLNSEPLKKPSVIKLRINPNKLNKNSYDFLQNQEKVKDFYRKSLNINNPIHDNINNINEKSVLSRSSSSSNSISSIAVKAQNLYKDMLIKKHQPKEENNKIEVKEIKNITNESKKIIKKVQKTSLESNLASKTIQMSQRMSMMEFDKQKLFFEKLLDENQKENTNFLVKIQEKFMEASSNELFPASMEETLSVKQEEAEEEAKKIEEEAQKKKKMARIMENKRISMLDFLKPGLKTPKISARNSVLPLKQSLDKEKEKEPLKELNLKLPEKAQEKIKDLNEKIEKIEDIFRNIHFSENKKRAPVKEIFKLEEVDAEYEKLQEDLGFIDTDLKKSKEKNRLKKSLKTLQNIKKLHTKKLTQTSNSIEISDNQSKESEKQPGILVLNTINMIKRDETDIEKELIASNQENSFIKKQNAEEKPEKIKEMHKELNKSKKNKEIKQFNDTNEKEADTNQISQKTNNTLLSQNIATQFIEDDRKDFTTVTQSNITKDIAKKPINDTAKPINTPKSKQPTPMIAPSPKLDKNSTDKSGSPLLNPQMSPSKSMLKNIDNQESSIKLQETPKNSNNNNKNRIARKNSSSRIIKFSSTPRISTYVSKEDLNFNEENYDLDKVLNNVLQKPGSLPDMIIEKSEKSPIKKSTFSKLDSPVRVRGVSKTGSSKFNFKNTNLSTNTNRKSIESLVDEDLQMPTSTSIKESPRLLKKESEDETKKLQRLLLKQKKEEIQIFLKNMDDNMENNILSQNDCIDKLRIFFEGSQKYEERKLNSQLKFSNQIKNPNLLRSNEIEMRKILLGYDKNPEDLSDTEIKLTTRVAGDFIAEKMRRKAFKRQKKVFELLKNFAEKHNSNVKQSKLDECLLDYEKTIKVEGEFSKEINILEDEKTMDFTEMGENERVKGNQEKNKEKTLMRKSNLEKPKQNLNRKETVGERNKGEYVKENRREKKFDSFFMKSKKRFKLKIV